MAEKIRYFVATLLLIAAIFGSWLVVNSIINNIDSQVIGSRLLIYVLPQFIGAAALYEKYFRKTGYVLGIYTSLFWGGFTLLSLYGRGQLLLQSSNLKICIALWLNFCLKF